MVIRAVNLPGDGACLNLESKSREKLYLSHFLVLLFWLLGKQRKELPFFLGTAGRKSDMISDVRTGKTQAWLKEGRRGK